MFAPTTRACVDTRGYRTLQEKVSKINKRKVKRSIPITDRNKTYGATASHEFLRFNDCAHGTRVDMTKPPVEISAVQTYHPGLSLSSAPCVSQLQAGATVKCAQQSGSLHEEYRSRRSLNC
ncbi:hypothetical protein PoB_003332100 [Plakobranchus ocellatus]|uniref:Uncharacterized protein n=1 Tax=Plakobranchus ocellatus TaxID=259542 RepID=A0AAV4AET7_9GAST|nr:hypothetical protein PoB_003332100 [Plakobranchus ocellatus]